MSKIEQTEASSRLNLFASPVGLGIYPVTESSGRSRPMQGSLMTSSQPFLTTIERPRCLHCQTRMMLKRVSSGPTGFEHRLFECPKCDHVEISVIASDPFQSTAIGWLAGELRAPS
jgi:hypothetical protein